MKKKQYDVMPAKFEKEPEYKDIKPADQSSDNDTDRITPANDRNKEKTDEAYLKNSTGSGTAPNEGRK
jgi:hypothetical protein